MDTPVAPRNIIELGWQYLHDSIGEFGIFLFFYLSMAALYALTGYFFYLADHYKWFQKYKIQYEKYATQADYKRCVKNLVLNYIVFILPLGCISFPLVKHLGMEHSLPLPSLKLYLFHIFLCLLGEDFFHYWMHRFFHWPWFYKHVHKEHHYYAAPFGLAASYAHPIEVGFLGLATFTPALLIRPHFITFYSWFVVRQLDAVLTHCGYEFPYLPFNIMPFYGGTEFHDFHHKAFTCNYASRFTWTDMLFGTYRKAPPITTKKVA